MRIVPFFLRRFICSHCDVIISSSVAKRELFSLATSMDVDVKLPEALPEVRLIDVLSSSVYINCCFFEDEVAAVSVSFVLSNFFDASYAAFSLFSFSLDNLSIIRDAVTLCRTFPESPVVLLLLLMTAAAAAASRCV